MLLENIYSLLRVLFIFVSLFHVLFSLVILKQVLKYTTMVRFPGLKVLKTIFFFYVGLVFLSLALLVFFLR
ncbi:hypothetical protein D6810_01765 [Candidatus Dojkabacteria bacterium]|uniref:Uncharacterized protein n=1 Tax=Candidatus Dojkabacteria bacterium TaxID=2099670 RepID=A0A3M0Z130_9BACT|nr:MAG: hypothetical protein D6810_01765 [Candidatus Dojkabacteria bacterium]